MHAMSSFVPIVVGIGDVVNRSLKLEDALEPADLVSQAIQNALHDTDLDAEIRLPEFRAIIDRISIVRSWTWPYPDLPGLLCSRLGIAPKHKGYSEHGGDKPVKLFDEAARQIAKGECKAAIVAGGEALASLTSFAKAGKIPPPGWTQVDVKVETVFSATSSSRERQHGRIYVSGMVAVANHQLTKQGIGKPHEIGAPVQVYPLFENGFRADAKQSMLENHRQSGQMYAAFAEIASRNEFAWNYGKDVPKDNEISAISEKNRLIYFPYPLLMNAFNSVNLAAACILTSTKVAEELGIPQKKWIYPLGGAGTQDSSDFWDRPNFHTSPALERSIDAALQVSALKPQDVDCFDFYSCFPIVPKLACRHLGLSATNPAKPITLLGGLTSFGGAGNDYSMHALTAMVRALRENKYQNGLVLGNGGILTYQYAVCLSKRPRANKAPYPTVNVLPPILSDIEAPSIAEIVPANSKATIETYTVEFDRQNTPVRGYVVGRLERDNRRFLANHGDADTLRRLASWVAEPIGREGVVAPDPSRKGRNLFYLDVAGRL